MREIRFRGKRVDNGEWVYGNYYIFNPISDPAPHIQEQREDGCWSFEVNPETVGEFTGLTDKNGKEIYEGDMLHDGEYTDLVQWEYAQWHLIPANDGLHTYNDGAEVIGNIHDGEWVEAEEVGLVNIHEGEQK